MLELWDAADNVVCLNVGYVEGRAGLARRAPRAPASARRLLDYYWEQIDIVEVEPSLIRLAARITEEHRLRALDALHLATAVQIAGELTFATWDSELADAARAEGFATVPT
jgi:predicted nucleic acid-binding protein